MALSAPLSPASATAVPDSRSTVLGYTGLLSGLHTVVPFEHLAVGASSVTGVALAVAASADLAFDIVERDAAGVVTVVQSGVLLAGALQADASGLSLSVPSFATSPTATYALQLPAYPEAASALVAGAVALAGIPADGASGLVAQVVTVLV
jgi:hypothetical protein